MKIKYILLIFLLIYIPSSNAVTITYPILFEIYPDTTYITIYNQSADFFNISSSNHYLDINLNNTHFNFTTLSNTSITNISINNSVSTMTLNGSGILTINISNNVPLSSFVIFLDGIPSDSFLTDSSGNLMFNFTGDGIQHILIITQISTIIQQTLQTTKTISCGFISNYESSAIIIFSISLMIFGFIFVLNSFKSQNYTLIVSGIMVVVIGFAILLLGNYLLSAIFTSLC